MPRQLINVIGAIAVIAILAIGALVIALPLYLQSLTTSAQAMQVAQTNSLYQVQVDGLRAEEERFDEIEADVADLRMQIPATTRADDVFEIVANAATATGVTIDSIVASDALGWVPRTDIVVPPPGVDGGATEDQTTEETTDGTGTPDAAADTPTSPQLSVPFSIAVTAADAAQAVAFLDALGTGPRLIAISSSTIALSDGSYGLTVEALAFVESED
ncbi:hypothetical protein LG299_00385 [Microbacterium lacus]|uniref:hypothetical protein n=1 Tax=Microbacterium lacus TaxID=415217 RepID=UPI0038503559